MRRGESLDKSLRDWGAMHSILGDFLIEGGDARTRFYSFGDQSACSKIYPIASLTKSFVAAAILILMERGHLILDEPLSKYIPRAKFDKNVTIRNLLNHTSAIPDLYTHKSWRDLVRPSTEAVLDSIFKMSLKFSPSEKYEYSNSNYILLGEVIRRVSKHTFATFIHENILTPLNLKNTVVGTRDNETVTAMSDVFSDGNMSSNVFDLATWVSGFGAERILKEPSYQLMTTPGKGNYGFGVSIQKDAEERTFLYHSGFWEGTYSFFARYPKEQRTIIYLGTEISFPAETSLIRLATKDLG